MNKEIERGWWEKRFPSFKILLKGRQILDTVLTVDEVAKSMLKFGDVVFFANCIWKRLMTINFNLPLRLTQVVKEWGYGRF